MGGYWRKEGPELRKLSPELIQRAKVVSDPNGTYLAMYVIAINELRSIRLPPGYYHISAK